MDDIRCRHVGGCNTEVLLEQGLWPLHPAFPRSIRLLSSQSALTTLMVQARPPDVSPWAGHSHPLNHTHAG